MKQEVTECYQTFKPSKRSETLKKLRDRVKQLTDINVPDGVQSEEMKKLIEEDQLIRYDKDKDDNIIEYLSRDSIMTDISKSGWENCGVFYNVLP
eukprot:UN14796